MRIAEVRALIDKYSDKQLRIIIAEMYKAMPKTIKEDKDIDAILKNPDEFTKKGKRREKKEQIPDIETLQFEAELFIEYAYNQYYFAPNRFVSKKERPKWRFIVKRLYKALLASATSEENVPLASTLLEKLYSLLCYSCSYVLFSAYDSFESVGIDQTTFFHSVLSLKFRHETKSDFVKHAITLILENSVNRYTLYSDLMFVALAFFKTPDVREMAIQTCDELLETIKTAPVKEEDWWGGQFERERKINHVVEMAFLCCAQLHEIERGIQYFTRNYVEKNREVKLYILLRLLHSLHQKDYFVQEYNKAVNNGIQPRKQLVKTFDEIQATGELPEHFY